MKTDMVIVGILVVMFAAILLSDAILTTWNPAGMFLSPNDVKGITGFVFAIIAALILIKARK